MEQRIKNWLDVLDGVLMFCAGMKRENGSIYFTRALCELTSRTRAQRRPVEAHSLPGPKVQSAREPPKMYVRTKKGKRQCGK